MNTVITNSYLFKEFKQCRALFDLSNVDSIDTTKNNAVCKYINSILNKYSLNLEQQYITGKRRTRENSFYSLNIMDNVDEIVSHLLPKINDSMK